MRQRDAAFGSPATAAGDPFGHICFEIPVFVIAITNLFAINVVDIIER
jgi:hypothetical protein